MLSVEAKGADALKLKLREAVKPLTWVLVTEPGSFVRAGSTFNYRGISPSLR